MATVCVYFEGEPYDVPVSYLPEHPGGGELISDHAEEDITQLFADEDHSDYARMLLDGWKRGANKGQKNASREEAEAEAEGCGAATAAADSQTRRSKKAGGAAAGGRRDWATLGAAAGAAVVVAALAVGAWQRRQ